MAKKHHRIPVAPHHRKPPTRRPKPAPMPGANEFSPEQEQAMRQGQRQANMAPAPDAGEPDMDDMGGM